jgi:hypothetical protein
MKTRYWLLAAAQLVIPASVAMAAPACHPPNTINFSPGTHQTRLTGTVTRGDQMCYQFTAHKGQTLRLDLSDDNNQSTMSVYQPGYTIKYGTGNPNDDDPYNDYQGSTVPGANSEEKQVRHLSTRLGQDGRYLLVIDLYRGGESAYAVKLDIK